MDTSHTNPFTWQRMVGLGVITGLMLIWIFWMVATYPTEAGLPKEQWQQFNTAAVLSVVFVLVGDAIAITWTLKRNRRLPEEEKDFQGPDPHLDRRIPVEAYTQSPLMRRAVARTLAKSGS